MFPLNTVWAYCQVKDRELSSGKGQDVDETGKTGAPVAERTVERSDFIPMDCGSGRNAAFAAGSWRATSHRLGDGAGDSSGRDLRQFPVAAARIGSRRYRRAGLAADIALAAGTIGLLLQNNGGNEKEAGFLPLPALLLSMGTIQRSGTLAAIPMDSAEHVGIDLLFPGGTGTGLHTIAAGAGKW